MLLPIEKKNFQLHAEIYKTLSNPIRLEIITNLREGRKSVKEITAITGVRQPTVSQHLALLRQKGVVSTQREGTNIYYNIANPKVTLACDLIHQVLLEHVKAMNKLTVKEVKTKT